MARKHIPFVFSIALTALLTLSATAMAQEAPAAATPPAQASDASRPDASAPAAPSAEKTGDAPAAPTLPKPGDNIIANAEGDKKEGEGEKKEGDGSDKPKEGDGEKPKEGDKKEGDGEGEKPKIEYTDFKLPDGTTVDEKVLGGFKDLAAKHALPQEAAQEFVDFWNNNVATARQQLVDAVSQHQHQVWKDTNDGWFQAVKDDAEIGGKNFDLMRQTIGSAIDVITKGDQDFNKGLREAMSLTGAGNNPHIVRAFYRLSRAVTEGAYVGGAPSKQSQNAAKVMYPNQGGTE